MNTRTVLRYAKNKTHGRTYLHWTRISFIQETTIGNTPFQNTQKTFMLWIQLPFWTDCDNNT